MNFDLLEKYSYEWKHSRDLQLEKKLLTLFVTPIIILIFQYQKNVQLAKVKLVLHIKTIKHFLIFLNSFLTLQSILYPLK